MRTKTHHQTLKYFCFNIMAQRYLMSINAGANSDFNDFINKKETSPLKMLVVVTLQLPS